MLLSGAQNISGMLRHAELCPSSPNLTQQLVVFHVVTGTKKKLDKTVCSGEWQISCPLCDSWKSLACLSSAFICILSACLYACQAQLNVTGTTLANPLNYLQDRYHLAVSSTAADSGGKGSFFIFFTFGYLQSLNQPRLHCSGCAANSPLGVRRAEEPLCS